MNNFFNILLVCEDPKELHLLQVELNLFQSLKNG